MRITFIRSEQLNDVTATFWFKPERRVRATAGEFVEITIGHSHPDTRGIHRWFTLSSSPTEPLIGITTTFARKSSSFKTALRALQPGDTIRMSDPLGDFLLPKDNRIPLVFVARGIGVTPVRSIATWLLDTDQRRTMTLTYAVADHQHVLYADLFTTTFGPQWHWTTERVHANDIVIADKNALYYLAGPEQMTKQLADELLTMGVSLDRIVTDYFPGYGEAVVEG